MKIRHCVILGFLAAACASPDPAPTDEPDGGTGTSGDASSGATQSDPSSSAGATATSVGGSSGGAQTTTDPAGDSTGSSAASSESGEPPPADCGFDPGVVFEAFGEIWQLEGPDGTCVWLERENVCPGICMANPFALYELRIAHDGPRVTIVPPATQWFETHHNWNDEAEGSTNTVRYHLNFPFKGGSVPNFSITAYAVDGGAVLWGPVALEPYVG